MSDSETVHAAGCADTFTRGPVQMFRRRSFNLDTVKSRGINRRWGGVFECCEEHPCKRIHWNQTCYVLKRGNTSHFWTDITTCWNWGQTAIVNFQCVRRTLPNQIYIFCDIRFVPSTKLRHGDTNPAFNWNNCIKKLQYAVVLEQSLFWRQLR